MTDNKIQIKGARVNNLKGIDVDIPRDKLVVITGVSGSGKSSLAFDTLYAEGQRRYVESLSSYARQFLGRMSKPECDYILGIPPAIAIEQRVNTRNARSTVGTSTEIYEYMRLLFGRVGHTFSPISGNEVKRHGVDDLISTMLLYAEGTKFVLMLKIKPIAPDDVVGYLSTLIRDGYVRIIDPQGKIIRIDNLLESYNNETLEGYYLLIDRLTVSNDKDTISRLTDSAENTFFEGDGECSLRFYPKGEDEVTHHFSNRFELDGVEFEIPTEHSFNFNSPLGACPTCEGYGKVVGIDENLVIPNQLLSLYDDAVLCWRGEKMGEWKKDFIYKSPEIGFPIHKPYNKLTDEHIYILWHGDLDRGIYGINHFFKMVEENQYKIQYRVMLARYRGKTVCPTCNGSRLKAMTQNVQVSGKNISELTKMSIATLIDFFKNIKLSDSDKQIASRLLTEIESRLNFLSDVGLEYLTLDRLSSTLSGGESQRINLATSLGSNLVGSLYILDEPSIGLHSRDSIKLVKILKQLKDLGNTIVVVEHDEDIMRAADYIIDIGPDAGRCGGEVVYEGDINNLKRGTNSHTIRYLTGEESIEIPKYRRKWNNKISIKGAYQNNLKGIDVDFPLNVFTVITGVSGSGKSSLVRDILFMALNRYFDKEGDAPGKMSSIGGDLSLINRVEFVNQNPIGKSSRSNPATYLKAFDEIRALFADTQLAKQMGFSAGYFSFNSDGGRCDECKGEGVIKVEMQFMADIVLVCDSCKGKRFKSSVLEVAYNGKSISDVLDMTINQAIEFFEESDKSICKRIIKRLKPLQDVGLGYLKMGQSSSTLSGGESQRIKLAAFLSNETLSPTLFIFDEPTTGLHIHDIKRLLKVFDSLVARGHTVVVIEHNLDVIKYADHIIDLGAEGGDKGGNLVFAGTPEDIINCKESYTGHYLKDKLKETSKN